MTAGARLGTGLLLALLVWGGCLAFREGVVAVLWKGVHGHIDRWEAGPAALTPEDWARSKDFVDQALDWDASDPQLLQTAGLLYWWGAWIGRDDSAASRSRLSLALDCYREAIRRRPAWPGAWLELAYAKHWQGAWDAEFQRAFATAWANGSWREAVILGLAGLGLDAWDKLTEPNRRIWYRALARAERRRPVWIRRAAREKGKVFVLCLALRDDPATLEWCRKQGYRG